jgi:hypothetical protein
MANNNTPLDPWSHTVQSLQEFSFNPAQQDFLHVGDPITSNITLHAGQNEMLRIAEDGFYVRGVKVPADDKESLTVYNAFKQFLVWAELNRR